MDWNFTAVFGVFDLEPNSSPQMPQALRNLREAISESRSEIRCSVAVGIEFPMGLGSAFLPFPSQLSHFLPAWPGERQHLLCRA